MTQRIAEVEPFTENGLLSFRASVASRGICTALGRYLCTGVFTQRRRHSRSVAQRVFTQRRRGAQRRRGPLSGSSHLRRRSVSLHPRLQEQDLWGQHSAGRGATALLGPPHAPRLRVKCSYKSNRNGNSNSRGGAEARRTALRVAIAVRYRVPLHPRLQKQELCVGIEPLLPPRSFRVLCASAALCASA